MADIQFYHLLTTPLEKALPKLLEKALASGMRCVVRVDSLDRERALDNVLWEYDAAFLPHATAQDPLSDRQPIYITHQDETPNEASVLVITDGRQLTDTDGYAKILDMFDGHNASQLIAARARWKFYKDSGVKLAYNKQQPTGGWKQEQTANAG